MITKKDYIELNWLHSREEDVDSTDTHEQKWFKAGKNATIHAADLNAPRRTLTTAEWETDDSDGWWYCENCEGETETPTPYCPHCGAEMANWWQAQHPEEQEEDKWDKADRIYYEKIRDTEDDPRFRGKGEDK